MSFFSWLRNGASNRPPRSRAQYRSTPPCFRPQLEVLEARDVPSTLTVTNSLDNGSAGSLRYEIAAAQSGDTIVFAKGVSGTIGLNSGFELYINKNLNIEGPGANHLAIQGGASRVFEVAAGVQVSLSGLTIENGDGRSGGFDPHLNDGLGGGILNWGTLMVNGCILTDNSNPGNGPSVDLGGGIYNAGTLTLSSSTVDHNYGGEGAGIYNDSTGLLTVVDSTVTKNYTVIAGTVLGECDLYNLGQFTDSDSKIGVNCS